MSELEDNIKIDSLPKHIGIIMDGNGRWATRRNLPREAGHRKGADAFERIVNHALKRGVKHLTVFAFSTENFRRPQKEVDAIMNLMRKYLNDQRKRQNKDVQVKFIGDLSGLPQDIREQALEMEARSSSLSGKKMILNIAFNYGGRDDILAAARVMCEKYANNEISDLKSFSEGDFSKLLYTATQPDVDLIIRTSGEERLSNFLIWQSAYAEMVFSPVLWPDYKPRDFDDALKIFAQRNRRLGGI